MLIINIIKLLRHYSFILPRYDGIRFMFYKYCNIIESLLLRRLLYYMHY